MIGMNQIKKRLLNGILIGLAIGLVFVIITIIISNNIIKGYKEGTNKTFLERIPNEKKNICMFSRIAVSHRRFDILPQGSLRRIRCFVGCFSSTDARRVERNSAVRQPIAICFAERRSIRD